MPGNWDFTTLDERIAAELDGFLPARVFDAHAHVCRVRDLPAPAPPLLRDGPRNVTPRVWRARVGRQVGRHRLAGGLLMSYPMPGADVTALNRRLLADLERAPDCRAAVLVAPDCRPEEIEALVEHPRVVGLKPYHVFARRRQTMNATPGEFLPRWAWRLADRRGLTIVMHLVRHGALADRGNQRELREMCLRHPGARVMLAHAARGFHAPNTARGVAAVAALENVWFDTSGICEAAPLVAVLGACGPRRLLWGSDFPVSEIRGRCVTVGDGFMWLDPSSVDWAANRALGRPTLVGLESLRALREAVEIAGLTGGEVRDIFYDNARRLFGLG